MSRGLKEIMRMMSHQRENSNKDIIKITKFRNNHILEIIKITK